MKDLLIELIKKQLAIHNVDESYCLHDLGADSLDTIEILIEIEARLGVSLNEEHFRPDHTVREWVERLEKKVGAQV